MSRKVQIIRLSQNITTKATTKPITIPSELTILVSKELLVDVGVAVAFATAVAVAEAVPTVGVAAGPVRSIVVSICVICVIAGLTPLSGNA